MQKSIDNAAERVFEILKGFGLQLNIFDGDGNKTVEPKQARKIFVKPNNSLVSLTDNDENSEIVLYLSAGTDMKGIKKLMDQLRQTAIHHNLQFTTRRFDKKISPKDFAFVGESRGRTMHKVEEAHNPMTGSMKSSYQNWNSAKLIVRHTKPVIEGISGARSRNIQKIFIETIDGERFKFPVVHLAGARAMARHLGAGGSFYDNVGQHIVGLSEEFKDMQKVSGHIFRNRVALSEGAFSLRETIRGRLDELRYELSRFMTISGYENKIMEVNNTEAQPLNEESLQEQVGVLKTMLKLDENDNSLDVALNRVASLVEKGKAGLEANPETVELVKRAYGEGEADESDFVSAAYLLDNPTEIKFSPPHPKAVAKKAELGKTMSPMQKLSWRLGAISERMVPNSDGVFVLSAILSRLAAKIDTALDSEGPNAKIKVNPAQQQIVQIFLKSVAPVIGESMKSSGYTDWDLNEALPLGHPDAYVDPEIIKKTLRTSDVKKHNKPRDSHSTVTGPSDRTNIRKKYPAVLKTKPVADDGAFKEARELSKWFESFDPLSILAKTYLEESAAKKAATAVEPVQVDNTTSLTEDDAWYVADFLVRGKATPKDIVTCYEEADRQIIANVLKENWTTETTEAIIKDLAIVEKSSCDSKEKPVMVKKKIKSK